MISKLAIALSLLAAVLLFSVPVAAQPEIMPAPAKTVLVPSGDFLFVVSSTAVFKLAMADLRIAGSIALPPGPMHTPSLAALLVGESLYVVRENQVFKIRTGDVSMAADVVLPGLLPPPAPVTPPAPPPPPGPRPPEPPLPTSSSMMKE